MLRIRDSALRSSLFLQIPIESTKGFTHGDLSSSVEQGSANEAHGLFWYVLLSKNGFRIFSFLY